MISLQALPLLRRPDDSPAAIDLGLASAVELVLGHVQQVREHIRVARPVALQQHHQLVFLDWPLPREAATSSPHEFLAPLLTHSWQSAVEPPRELTLRIK